MKLRYITLLIVTLLANIAFSQEVLTPLSTNPSITNNKKLKFREKSLIDISKPIYIPIVDDFSYEGPYPSLSIWMDSNVFVNNINAINPITFGVATFDAVNKYGKIYSDANNAGFNADYLTSRMIRLDSTSTSKLGPADSLYLSFYFQPQGSGPQPDENDSLILQFKSFPPDTIIIDADTAKQILADTILRDKWVHVWAHQGMTYLDFKKLYGTDFKQIRIPITDSVYFRNDFQFRFLNRASIANTPQPTWAGNTDFWNLDYVYLNKNRNFKDSIIDDVAITKAQTGLLKSYSAMPWSHFLVNSASEMNTVDTIPYKNLGINTKNVKREFYINDLKGSGTPFFYSGGNLNLLGNERINFAPQISYTYNSNVADSASFEVLTTINTTPDFNRSNDTSRFIQKFENFYAYDDGTPEYGFGLDNAPGGMIACKFNARKTDTIRGVNIFFNNVLHQLNEALYFNLMIWKDLNSNNIIYKKTGLLPITEDSLNEFHYYRIDTAIAITGDFYVGMQQIAGDILNIGFDVNNTFWGNSSSLQNNLLFCNIAGTWYNSIKKGMPMIRPVFGKKVPYGVGIAENNRSEDTFKIYPNPANDILYISNNKQESTFALSITDLSGRVVMNDENKTKIDISSLNPGYYIASIKTNNLVVHQQKLIIIR